LRFYLEVSWKVSIFATFTKQYAIMTVREMKNDAVRRINLLDESDEKAVQSIWLYVKTALPLQEEMDQETLHRTKAKELAHSFLGSFAASRTEKDWKQVKEDYLIEKYSSK
jgi:hypothetical protein